MHRSHILATAMLLAAPFAASAGPTSFNDGVMNPASYSVVSYNTDPSVNIAISQLASGGHPGTALDIHFSNDGGAVSMTALTGFIDTAFNYDPSSQGALTGLSYANDRYVDVGAVLNPSLNTLTRSLLSQGGHYYVATAADVQLRGTWFTTISGALTATDYSEISFATGLTDATNHPDFSSTGSLIGLGFANRFFLDTVGSPFALDGVFRYDNISYSLSPAVPEPQTYALMLAGLSALFMLQRRRVRR